MDVPDGTTGVVETYCVGKVADLRLRGVFIAVPHRSIGRYDIKHTAATFARETSKLGRPGWNDGSGGERILDRIFGGCPFDNCQS